MPPIKKKQYKTLYFSIIFLLCCIFLLLPLNGSQRNGESFKSNDTNFTLIEELWTGSQFDSDNFVSLMKAISGDKNFSVGDMTKINEMAKTPTTSDVFKKNNENEIVVTVGGLTWTPTYLSTDKSGNPILTLWLAQSTQLYSKGSNASNVWAIFFGSTSSPDTQTYPSAMYGMSYMRAVVLNNGGYYATSIDSKSEEEFVPTKDSAFAPFTIPEQGEEYNDITDFIVKPIDVSWQENGQSGKKQFGDEDNPNDCWSNSVSDEGFMNAKYNYAHKEGNDTWKNDYIWLPSYTEVGRKDSGKGMGMWHTSGAQRRNSVSTWLRSGSYIADSPIYLYAAGGSISNTNGGISYGVRPAFHLNLKAAAISAAPEFDVSLLSGYDDNSALDQITVRMGQKGNRVSVPTRTGYVFKGFYTEMNGGGKQYIDKNGDFVREWEDTAIDKLYASWEPKSYNITFNANDEVYGKSGYINNGSTYTQIMSMGSSIEITPKREGYDFLYFTQEKDAPFSTTFTLDDKNMFTLNTEFGENGSSVTLYAQWKIKSYNITFKGNYGTINKRTDYTDTYEYGEKITLKKNVDGDGGKNLFYLYKLGYQFSKFDVGTISDDTFTIPDLGKDQAEVSITAQWIERSYTFEFNAGANTFKDGTGPSSQTKLYSAKLTMPDAQSEGYILAGWYAQNTSGRTYTYKQVVPVNELTQGKENEQTITLYAQWEETWANYAEMPDKVSEYSNEYLVSSPEHLGWIANELQNGKTLADYIFRQTKNIDLNDYTWFNGGTFEGQYYGNGYYILNIHSSTNENVAKYDYQGLFAQTYYSVLQNIHILSGNIVGNDNVGAIVGKAENTVIRNCVNHANVFGSCWVAGIVGYKKESNSSSASATISGCVNYGQITGDKYNCYLGGIVGQINNSTIDACYVRANISGYSYSAVGGIAGFTNDNTIISSCAFVGESAANGIVGNGNNNSFVIGCLVDSTKADNLLPDGAENCVAYVNGELKTAEPTDKSTWTKINGKWFPSGLAWIG